MNSNRNKNKNIPEPGQIWCVGMSKPRVRVLDSIGISKYPDANLDECFFYVELGSYNPYEIGIYYYNEDPCDIMT